MSRALSAVYTVISIQHYGEVLQCGPFCLLEYSHQVVREVEGQFIDTFFAYDEGSIKDVLQALSLVQNSV